MQQSQISQHTTAKGSTMKKQALFAAVFLLFGMSLAYGQKTLTVSSDTGFPGDTVTIDVNINDGSGVGGLQFDLNYNDSILSIVDSDGDGDLNDEIARGTSLTVDHTLTVNASSPGLISVIAVGVSSMNAGAGNVIRATFQISAGAGPGDGSGAGGVWGEGGGSGRGERRGSSASAEAGSRGAPQ